MTTRLSAIPVIVDRNAIPDANERNRNPTNRCDTNQSIISVAKRIDREDASVEGEDGEFDRGDAAVVHLLQQKGDLG